MYPIRNDFFGETIVVAGLVTGGDLIAQLRGKKLGSVCSSPPICSATGSGSFWMTYPWTMWSGHWVSP